MKRTTLMILLFASGGLLASRLVSPAASLPEPRAAAAPSSATSRQAAPAAAESAADVDAEVDRMRDRLSAPPKATAPTRDPFAFGRSPQPRRGVEQPRVENSALAAAVALRASLPTLVAILSPADDANARTAVLSVGDDVQMKKTGDEIGGFRIESVSAGALVLVDRATNATFTIPLH
jgi:hypothetical protein